jgi:hypothetical protein
MSISKKIIVSLSLLAVIGGISIAIISVSANGKLVDTQAFAFIQNNDLNAYKTYTLNEQATRINNIDQARFDKIKKKYINAKPLMELQTKYEALLTPLATNKDQTGFANTYREYINESQKLMPKKMSDKLTPEKQNQMIERAYQKAVKDLASGNQINLSRYSGRHFGTKHMEEMIK